MPTQNLSQIPYFVSARSLPARAEVPTSAQISMSTSNAWMFDNTWWRAESQKLQRKINSLPYDTKREMTKLFEVCEDQAMAIWREEITCRYHNKQTEKHVKLVQKFRETHNNLEQHVVMALLMRS
jgi:hypothetical protein